MRISEMTIACRLGRSNIKRPFKLGLLFFLVRAVEDKTNETEANSETL
jgi:hypothetical protein